MALTPIWGNRARATDASLDGRRFAWDVIFQATPYKEPEPDETRRPEPASVSGIRCRANGNRLLRAVLQEAHAERLGIWVGIWPVTLLVLSYVVEKKVQG